LLADIRDIFGRRATSKHKYPDQIPSEELVAVLCAMEEAPWSEKNGGRAITKNWIANRLKPFKIHSTAVWHPSEGAEAAKRTVRGYKQEVFIEAWKRYLPQFF
jgi:hypothetical protein